MKILNDLERTTSETLEYFELSDQKLSKTYGPDKWNIKQILHHLADAETVLYDRIRRAISRPRQVVWGFDQDAWCEKLDYENMPLDISKNIFSSIRSGIYNLAKNHYEKDGPNEYVHSETGLRTLEEEFDKVVWHCENHLDQIRRVLGD